MDTFAVERKTGEILDALAGFGAQWSKFSEQVDKVEKHLGTLNNSFNDLAGPRRNQLERQLGKLEAIRSRSIEAESTRPQRSTRLRRGRHRADVAEVSDRSAS
jgi:DNA anti-recombination protein RmuC